jgi:hypothetical protein
MSTLLLLAAMHGLTLASGELELMPVIVQDVVLFRSDDVTAGGAGGGVGVQLRARDIWLAQLDASALWMLGNVVSTRVAFGVQWPGAWSPAAWICAGVLWGDRMEFLQADGRRPSIPSWSLGVRASPLRLSTPLGVFSALEPGVGTDFASGLWLELSIVQLVLRL